MQYLYKQFMHNWNMSDTVWKCFRCNLSFKDENLSEMHKQISKHSITKVKAIVA